MSNLSSVGFIFEDEAAFSARIGEAFARATAPPELGEGGTGHRLFRDSSGAAIAFHVDRSGIRCITPFFLPPAGGTNWWVGTSSPHPDEDCRDCSGADCDVFEDPTKELVTRSTIQWLFFAPYADWLRQERRYEIQAVGFASMLRLCRTEEEWEATQAEVFGGAREPGGKIEPGRPMRLADEAFLPYGMFKDTGDVGARARVYVAGHVEQIVHPTNGLTGERFTWVRLRSIMGRLDIVAPFEGEAQCGPGTRAFADVWLVGRPVEPPPKRGFWLKLLGG